MRLSENFTLEEMVFSEIAVRLGIDNVPGVEEVKKLKLLAQECLQPIRDEHGITIISSGFRSLNLNRTIGSFDSSQHIKGEAADLVFPRASLRSVYSWIIKNIEFDQVILEFGKWIHISYNKGNNRKRALLAIKEDGKTVYKAFNGVFLC